MSRGFRRWAARTVSRAFAGILPPDQREWAAAMAQETDHVDSDGDALRFAIGCLGAAIALRARRTIGADKRKGDERMTRMGIAPWTGLAAAGLAVAAGALLMHLGDAPRTFLAVNLLTACLALLAFPFARRPAAAAAARPGLAALGAAAAVALVATLAPPFDGVARWVRLGPVAIQISLVALPLLVAAAGARSSAATNGAVMLGAAALALQPDRAMACALLAAMTVLVATGRERARMAAALVCLGAAAAAFARPDAMPAVPFVDGVVPQAAAIATPLAILVAAAMILLPLPFLLVRDPARRTTAQALAALWAAAVAAAFLGNYPSPLAGYGASAILGYALSWALLLPRAGKRGRNVARPGSVEAPAALDPDRRNRAAVPA